MEQPGDYYSKNRSELLDLMPPLEGTAVLDVGCGEGGLGRLLKEKGCSRIYGIEPVTDAARIAETAYDRIFNCDVESAMESLPEDLFDIIVCADVLEHLKDPWEILERLKKNLKRNGAVVASIPNIRNGRVIGRLLRGEFGYDKEGILDKTHLRFFTFNGIIRLFGDCGYKVVQIVPVYYKEAETQIPLWMQNDVPAKLEDLARILTGSELKLRDDELLDFFTFQFLLRAVPVRQ